MLLDVVACCCESLKPVKPFRQQLPTFLLFCDRRNVVQQCWIRFHGSSNIVGGNARSLYKDLWVVFFSRCTAGPRLFGSCCIPLHTTANTHATTPNINCWRNNVGSCRARLHAAQKRDRGTFLLCSSSNESSRGLDPNDILNKQNRKFIASMT